MCYISFKEKIKITFQGTEYKFAIISQILGLQFLLLLEGKMFPIVITRDGFFDNVNLSDHSMKQSVT